MKDVHPLKRKSIKPSSSTVRGMLPAPQFRSLDAAMQSLRSAGLRLDWEWKNATLGWVCNGMLDDKVVCELRPTEDPLIGAIVLSRAQHARSMEDGEVPAKFKKILQTPVEESTRNVTFEFPLAETRFRDLFSELIEALLPLFE